MQSEELILQAHQGENAPAALAMILAHHGIGVSIGELSARRLESAADLISAARAYGLYAQGYRMSCQELYQATLPLIAHWRFREFVVVTAVRGEKVTLNSPAEGRLIVSKADFEACFTGVALCFASDSTSERPDLKQTNPQLLLRGFPAVAALLAVSEVFICLCCVMMILLLRVFTGMLSSQAGSGGGMVCALMGALLLMQGGACGMQLWLLRRCANRLSVQVSRDMEARLDSENAAFFMGTSRYRLGLVGAGCSKVPASMTYEIFYLLQLITAAVCLGLMAVQDLFVTVAAAVVAVSFTALCVLGREELYSDEKLAVRNRSGLCEQLAGDALMWDNMRLSGENRMRFWDWLGQAGAAVRLSGKPRQKRLWHGFVCVELLMVFCVCLLRILSGAAGMSALMNCIYLAGVFAGTMAAFPRLLSERMLVRGIVEELGNVFQGEAPGAEGHGGLRADDVTLQNGSIRFGNGAEAVMEGITFRVRTGELLVVECGEEEGRKALSRVLSGLEPPVRGALYLGSVSVGQLSENEIFKNITLLGNGLPFPSGTVRENIAAGFLTLTDYAVAEAALDAMLHRNILLRKKGYDTPVSSLSDGERVLLEFACAFARGTPFLVACDMIDILDQEMIHGLMQALRRRGIGAVLLTGETSVLRREADLVCRIEEGKTTLLEQADFLNWEVHSGV